MYRSPLDLPRLVAALPAGWRIRVVAQTASTNADLLAAATAGEAEGLLLVADHQTAGRGRLERTWTSPPRAGLTMSLLLRPSVPLAQWGWLPLLAGVALAETVGPGATLKWPNDLLLGPASAKAAGILVQTDAGAAVLGIGLNVSNDPAELPAGVHATSLKLAQPEDRSAQVGDRSPVCLRLIAALHGWYESWQAAGGDAEGCGLAAAYRQLCATLGRPVSISTPAGPLQGTAVGIDASGQLLLAGDGAGGIGDGAGAIGAVRTIAAGDVTHVRPGR